MNKKKRLAGSFYLETIIALGILGIVATSLVPVMPELLKATQQIKDKTKLIMITEYIGEYLFRWVSFAPENKHRRIEHFLEGQDLELTGEIRVNKLPWASSLIAQDENITDHYKTTIKFWETVSRNYSAVIQVWVWYDEDLDKTRDVSENAYTFSTIITEKRDL
ncbi:MAG: hypothetical protein GY730_03370 [bacterium]|nr:hypothetical protein [bacterium]